MRFQYELIRNGARQIISEAVEAELAQLLEHYLDLKDDRGRQAVVRNGYLPERSVQTGVGDVAVQVPKRSGNGVGFNSALLLPPYLKRAKSVEELIPWLYLRGVSTGDFQQALTALLGEQASGLSPVTISRLKDRWQDERRQWQSRDLSNKRYVYLWAPMGFAPTYAWTSTCACWSPNPGRKALWEGAMLAITVGFPPSPARPPPTTTA